MPLSVSDAQFLGRYRAPEDLHVEDFANVDSILLQSIAQSYITSKVFSFAFGLRGNKAFGHAVGQIFLEGVGLNDACPFTLNAQSRDEILANNPDLRRQRFHLVEHDGRPYLIVGGTIRSYDVLPASDPEGKRIPVEYTPLYAGVRHGFLDRCDHTPIGGGYIESFAYDSRAARPLHETGAPDDADVWRKPPAFEAELSKPFLLRASPTFALRDVMASTGAAPAELGITTLLWFPRYWHWSPAARDGTVAPAQRRAHADGGLSDNLGLMPLLARHVQNIIAFVNTEQPINPRAGAWEERYPDYVVSYFDPTAISGDAGSWVFPSSAYSHNKVFTRADLDRLHEAMLDHYKKGEPLVHMDTYDVLPNDTYEVAPYQKVRIVWVFLGPSPRDPYTSNAWVNAIRDEHVRTRLKTDRPISPDWDLRKFPQPGTFLSNQNDLIRLTEPQASALAHFTSWVVVSQADQIRGYLRLPKQAR